MSICRFLQSHLNVKVHVAVRFNSLFFYSQAVFRLAFEMRSKICKNNRETSYKIIHCAPNQHRCLCVAYDATCASDEGEARARNLELHLRVCNLFDSWMDYSWRIYIRHGCLSGWYLFPSCGHRWHARLAPAHLSFPVQYSIIVTRDGGVLRTGCHYLEYAIKTKMD